MTNELGHVIVSGLSLHCHGFVELLCQERVEYAWLMKLTIQRIAGAVSTLQVRSHCVHTLHTVGYIEKS